MRNSFIFYLVNLAGLISIISSCTETINIELDRSYSKLTVFGEISTDTAVHIIRLTRSADYFYNQTAQGVPGADVKIRFDNEVIQLYENTMNAGTYETPPGFYGIPGKIYSLFIQNVDINNDGIEESYSASSYLPFLASPDSIKIKYVKYPFFKGSEILLYARDPAETIDFYAFKVARNGVLQTDSLSEIIVQNDILFNGNYTNGISVQYLDDSKDGEKVFMGDTITFEMYGLTLEYYNFIIQAQTELRGSNPLFSGTPSNLTTNLSDDALGFFAAVNIKRATAVAPSKE